MRLVACSGWQGKLLFARIKRSHLGFHFMKFIVVFNDRAPIVKHGVYTLRIAWYTRYHPSYNEYPVGTSHVTPVPGNEWPSFRLGVLQDKSVKNLKKSIKIA